MSPEQLTAISEKFNALRAILAQRMQALDASDPNSEDTNVEQDEVAEAVFLRCFTSYESTVEKLFLHYACGGETLDGRPVRSFLSGADESRAKAIIRGSWRFISWSKVSTVRDLASLYLNEGWPVTDVLSTKTQALSDCEKIRNRIAHNSSEVVIEFAAVQRNNFGTERMFDISPGHLLRARHPRRRRVLILGDYVTSLLDTGDALLTPPE